MVFCIKMAAHDSGELKLIVTRVLTDINDISYPRLVGTEGEKRAQSQIQRRIEESGYQPQTESFNASYFRINTLAQLSNCVAVLLFILTGILFQIHPLLFLIPLGLIFYNVYLFSTGTPEWAQPPNVPRFVHIYPTENIYTETAKHPENPEIVFVGHYDSKSSALNGVLRLLMYLILLLGVLGVIIIGPVGIILYFIYNTPNSVLVEIMWVFVAIGSTGGFVLCFNVIGNRSPGACDNGSAVGILLGLMTYFKAHPIPNANLTFLFSGAEEIGLTGALNFIRKRKDDPAWNKKRVFVINFDMAGLPGSVLINTGVGLPKKLTSPTMSKYLEGLASANGIPMQEVYLPGGGWTDALPFTHFGYEAITFSGKNPKVHSMGDVPSCLDATALHHALIMAIELTKKVADEFQRK